METAIGVFDSRERAEEAVKELLEKQIPEQAIIFLTRSESEAMSFGKEIGSYAGGFLGGAVGTTAGCVGAALALIPGFGQVFALGVGGAALLGYLGSKAGASIAKGLAEQPSTPKPTSDERAREEAAHLLEVLKSGRSLVLVQSEFHDGSGSIQPRKASSQRFQNAGFDAAKRGSHDNRFPGANHVWRRQHQVARDDQQLVRGWRKQGAFEPEGSRLRGQLGNRRNGQRTYDFAQGGRPDEAVHP